MTTIIINPGWDYTVLYAIDNDIAIKHIFKHKGTNITFNILASYISNIYKDANIIIDTNGCGIALADCLSKNGLNYIKLKYSSTN